MRQRGRKSAASAAVPNVTGEPLPLKPPAGLNRAEQSLFAQVISACSPLHFVESDLPLLVSFVQSTLMVRRAVRDPAKVAVWEKAVRVQAMLATRLRLSPQARTDPKTIGRHMPQRTGPPPWEI
jgi:hypothetical protein